MNFPRTEEELISRWLDLTGDTFGQYAWAGPATWASLGRYTYDVETHQTKPGRGGFIGDQDWPWVKPEPFSVKILMNPFAGEGQIYLAHAGTKYLEYVNL
jgi:hypothetical protein